MLTMIILTLSEDRMEIKKKKFANVDSSVWNVGDAPQTHTSQRKKRKKENINCLLRVISQVDEIFKNKNS